MAIVEVSIIPLGTKTPSVSKHLARPFRALQQEKDIKYELNSMGTTMEGDLEKILGLVMKMHEATFDGGIMRVVTTIRIDDRRDRALTMSGKIESLQKELKR